MLKKIILNGREIQYDFQRKKVKNVNLRIKPDQTIHVSAGRWVSEEFIRSFIISKADYILSALDRYAEMAKNAPRPKCYVDGEMISVLGLERELKVVGGCKRNCVEFEENFDSAVGSNNYGIGSKCSVASNGHDGDDGINGVNRYVVLKVKDVDDFELKKKVIDKWLTELCKEVVEEVCREVYPAFEQYGIAFPELKFRKMVSRWGSCQPNRGILTFNTLLVEAPIECIEYVVVHEFTHFLHPDHSKRFYAKVAEIMPDWRERKGRLERYSVRSRE